MLPLHDLHSAVGLYHYTRWVQNCVHMLHPYLAPHARTPDVVLHICEYTCTTRRQSPAQVHCVHEADLALAQDYFRTITTQELQALALTR